MHWIHNAPTYFGGQFGRSDQVICSLLNEFRIEECGLMISNIHRSTGFMILTMFSVYLIAIFPAFLGVVFPFIIQYRQSEMEQKKTILEACRLSLQESKTELAYEKLEFEKLKLQTQEKRIANTTERNLIMNK